MGIPNVHECKTCALAQRTERYMYAYIHSNLLLMYIFTEHKRVKGRVFMA